VTNPPQLCHPEAPRSYQRGEGSGVQRLHSGRSAVMLRARSLAWLKGARLRDDAFDERGR
jgi:hypothetical protein